MNPEWLAYSVFIAVLVAASAPSFGGSSADRSPFSLRVSFASRDALQNVTQRKRKENKQERKSGSDTAPEEFSGEVAEQVIQLLTSGLEGHSAPRMLSAFDGESMDSYLNFQNQIAALFDRYDSFRVHFRIAQIKSEGATGVALVDFEIEEIPRSADTQPVRKSDELRIEIKRGKKGWKIVDLKPREFFF